MPEESTEKPLALLIPGLDGTGKLYYRQTIALARKYRVLPWDFGPGDDFDLDGLAALLGQATAGEPQGSMLVVAESFGGLIALTFVLHYPERVRGLILVNTFPYYRWRGRIFLARRLVALLTLKLASRVKDLVVNRILVSEGIPAEDRRRYVEIIRTIDHDAYRRRLQLIQRSDLRARLREVAVPVVLLAAGRDKIVPSVREARFMAARIPRARVVEFPEAGHALLLTPGVCLADYDPQAPVNSDHRQNVVAQD